MKWHDGFAPAFAQFEVKAEPEAAKEARAGIPVRSSVALEFSSGNYFRPGGRQMRVRGKVLREPNSGPGLLMIEGRQFRFSREALWKSEVAPKPGLAVSVELDRDLQVLGITAIPEAQLAEERVQAPGPRIGSERIGVMFSRLVGRIAARVKGTL